MNRNLGASAGVIALLAFVLHIAIPGGPGEAPAPIEVRNAKGGKNKPGKAPPENKPERTPEGPWLATQAFFHPVKTPRTPLLSPPKQKETQQQRQLNKLDFDNAEEIHNCSAGTKAGKRKPGETCAAMLKEYFGFPNADVQFMLATVPDPLHTKLALFTDSSIEAIQKAATDAGWDFATQWLPWSDEVDPDETSPSVRAVEREFIRKRETQPGILVFRRHHIEQKQVLVIFLVGETPTAGVNATEFHNARAYMRAIQNPERQIKIQGPTFSGSLSSLTTLLEEEAALKLSDVRSGTVSDSNNASRFGKEFHFWSPNLASDFREAVSQLGIEPQDAALLAEDETDYGSSEIVDRRVFRFPREISHLRNAYRETLPTTRPNGAPAADLDFSLKDSDVAEDSIPTFAKTQTALSQNGVVNEITSAINRHRIRIVEIEATNVLDLLFLARVLKQQCPDTKLLIPYADLLFLQVARSDALTGTLALSPYPLFEASNAWTGQESLPFTFPASSAQGVYEATMQLLNQAPLLQVEPPKYPPHWLLTLDREGFAPVRYWPDGERRLELTLPEAPPTWMFLSDVMALLAASLFVWVKCLERDKTIRANTAFAIETMDESIDGRRLFYLFLLAVLLIVIQVVLGVPLWFNHTAQPKWLTTWVLPWIGIVLAGWCAGLAVRETNPNDRTQFGIVVSLVILALGLWVACCCYWPNRSGFFFSFRAMEMRIGTSPMWPIIAALGVLFLFCLFHLKRLNLVVYETPEVPVGNFESHLRPRMEEFYKDFNLSAQSALGVLKFEPRKVAGGIGFAVLLFGVARMDQHLSSIDVRVYDILSLTLILTASAVLLLACWQVTSLWRSLQGLLKCLKTLPLARSFISPDGSGSKRPLWVRLLNLQSVDILMDALIVLHDMSRLDRSWRPLFDAYSAQIKLFVDRDPMRERLRAHNIKLKTRNISKAIAVSAFQLAREQWVSSALVERLNAHSTEQDDGQCQRRHAPLEIDADPKSLSRLAETFVALHFSSFLLYGVSQIRNLLLFISFGFVLLVFSLNSYGHQSPQLVGRLLLAMFILIGCVIWTCLTGMERDPILSRIAGTTPGKLNTESYVKVLGFGALPVLGILASQFPAISNFLYSWIAPSLQSAH